MKLGVKYIVILSWAIPSLVWAAWAEDIYAPKYSDVRFSRTSVAVITERAAYVFDRKVGLGKPFIGALANDFLPSTALQKLDTLRISNEKSDDTTWDQWQTAKGIVFQTTYGYCDEGAETYHGLRYVDKPIKKDASGCHPAHTASSQTCLGNVEINTHFPACESISDIEVIDDQLWLGSYESFEGGSGAGSGVRVISLKTKQLIAAFSPKQKSMVGSLTALNFDAATGKLSIVKKAAAGRANGAKLISESKGQLADGYVLFIRHDPMTNDVWVLTKTALHRISKEKINTRWYLSEQFNTEGRVTLLASLKPQKSNPWAIMARYTKLLDTKAIWKQLQQSPKLAKKLTYAYDDEGKFFSIGGKRLEAYATVENNQTTMLMWDYDLSRADYAQELINRLNSK